MTTIDVRAETDCPNYFNAATHIGAHFLEMSNAIQRIQLRCPFGDKELHGWATITRHSIQVIASSPTPARYQSEHKEFASFLVMIEEKIKERALAAA